MEAAGAYVNCVAAAGPDGLLTGVPSLSPRPPTPHSHGGSPVMLLGFQPRLGRTRTRTASGLDRKSVV